MKKGKGLSCLLLHDSVKICMANPVDEPYFPSMPYTCIALDSSGQKFFPQAFYPTFWGGSPHFD